MLRLAILLSLSTIFVAGYIKTSQFGLDDNGLESEEWRGVSDEDEGEMGSPLWVLRLGEQDLGDLKLRRGTEAEERDFDDAATPVMAKFERRQNKPVPKVPKQNTKLEVQDHDDKVDKKKMNDIIRIVNKFVMSTSREPDVYLTDTEIEYEPSLAIYIKDPFTSLTVRYGKRQWNYFIGPPSPLPAWFYQQHSLENEQVVVPSYVKTDFLKLLVHMLQMFLSFPV